MSLSDAAKAERRGSVSLGSAIRDLMTVSKSDLEVIQKERYGVDPRSRGEFASGHMEGAVNIPQDEVTARMEVELPVKSRGVMLDCTRAHLINQNAIER